MTNDFLSADKANITLVQLESQSFEAFEQWMDEQLDLLVARWIHTAAPNASRESLRQQVGLKTRAE